MNTSPFISLNSWNEPGAILQAAEPEEIVEGGPDEWGKLREPLARRRERACLLGSGAGGQSKKTKKGCCSFAGLHLQPGTP